MEPIPCFFIEPTDRAWIDLRRYRSLYPDGRCPASGTTLHDAFVRVEEIGRVLRDARGFFCVEHDGVYPRDDPRWPTRCACGYAFQPEDEWQVFTSVIYRRIDTGEEMSLRNPPPGALWYADWRIYPGSWTGPDGHVLECQTPGGPWCIDSRASNCTRPGDDIHRCWVRHGDPRDPLGLVSGQPLHVDKCGDTCSAGAGSILCGSYHGFLHGGRLVSC